MSQTYQEYEQEYNQSLSRVRSFLSSHARSLTTLKECDRLLSVASRCAAAMETIAGEENNTFQLQECRMRVEREVTPLMNEVQGALREKDGGGGGMDVEQRRNELFAGGSNSGGGYASPNLDGGETGDMMQSLIRDSDDLLSESRALCAESEEIGSGTLGTMGMQREQLTNASDYLRGARGTVDQARGLLQDMNRKALRNKRFLYCVIAVLILANLLVLIAVIKKHTK